MTPHTTGVNLENVTAHGSITISGVTVQNIAQMVERPRLWVNVPRLPAYFFGRDDLVNAFVQQLSTGPAPTIAVHGPPGVGKFTLAVVLAHHPDVLAHFADGILWAGLGPMPDVSSQLATWAAALGIDLSDQPTAAARAQAVKNAIGQQRLLLIIEDARQLEPALLLLCGGSNCAHLVLTRDIGLAHQVAGEAQTFSIPVLDDDSACALLETLAPTPCAADPAAASQLTQAVGGLPLALKLVGGFLAAPEISLFAELSAEASDAITDPGERLQLATVGLGALDDDQATLQDSIALSLEHLPQFAVAAFHALGAFAPKPAIFDLDAAKDVTQVDAGTLATLVGRNLVEQAGPETLALHPTVSDVARAALPTAAIERHRDYYLGLVDEDQGDWERIQRVYPQVQQALAWQEARQPEDARTADFFSSLHAYLTRQGLWEDYARMVGLGLVCAQAHQDAADEAAYIGHLGFVHNALGDKQLALDYYHQALPMLREVGDETGTARSLNNIGRLYDDLGDMQQALDYYHQALPLLHQIGDQWAEAINLSNIGYAYHALGDMQQALDCYNQALPLTRQVGDRTTETAVVDNIAHIYSILGDMQQALDYYNQALSLVRQFGDRAIEITVLGKIAHIYSTRGDMEQALNCYHEALTVVCEAGDRVEEAATRIKIGQVCHALGDKQQTLSYFKQALPILQQAGDRAGEAAILNNIGSIYSALGDKQQALDHYRQALFIRRQMGDRFGEATTLNSIGLVYFNSGVMQWAMDFYRKALIIRCQVGDRFGEVITRYNIAMLHEELGDLAAAEEQLQQVVALEELIGHPDLEHDRRGLAHIQDKRHNSRSQYPRRSWRYRQIKK